MWSRPTLELASPCDSPSPSNRGKHSPHRSSIAKRYPHRRSPATRSPATTTSSTSSSRPRGLPPAEPVTGGHPALRPNTPDGARSPQPSPRTGRARAGRRSTSATYAPTHSRAWSVVQVRGSGPTCIRTRTAHVRPPTACSSRTATGDGCDPAKRSRSCAFQESQEVEATWSPSTIVQPRC